MASTALPFALVVAISLNRASEASRSTGVMLLQVATTDRNKNPNARETGASLGGGCDPEVPRYDLKQWALEHGKTLPDHPAVFYGHKVDAGFKEYANLPRFLGEFGDEVIEAYPEYAQAGGAGAEFGTNAVQKAPAREIMRTWGRTHAYYANFNCNESKMCHRMMPHLGTPELFEGPTGSTNFLLGGKGSGLPLHEHEKTWQGLLAGRKAWYLIPPQTMTTELHDSTGPFLIPVRGWASAVEGLPLGRRPLRCVQHPGEIFYFPDHWFHGTLNLDEFQLSWGAKPFGREQQHGSAELGRILGHFPSTAMEQANFPYAVGMRLSQFRRTCKTEAHDALAQLEAPLAKVKSLAERRRTSSGGTAIVAVAAWARCRLASRLWEISADQCPAAPRRDLAERWLTEATRLSPEVSKVECTNAHLALQQ